MTKDTNKDELTKNLEELVTLEEKYPEYDRRLSGWKLIGFKENKNTGRTRVPVYRYFWPEKSKYSAEKLRELRKERGVSKTKVKSNG